MTKTTGVWKGSTEPSYAVDVQGDRDEVRNFAADLRDKWEQEGVMVFSPSKAGSHATYRFPGVDPNEALAGMEEADLPGGTIRDGDTLEIMGDDQIAENIARLQARLGVDAEVHPGELEFL